MVFFLADLAQYSSENEKVHLEAHSNSKSTIDESFSE